MHQLIPTASSDPREVAAARRRSRRRETLSVEASEAAKVDEVGPSKPGNSRTGALGPPANGSWFGRSLPSRLLDTALRVIRDTEGTHAETADRAAHEQLAPSLEIYLLSPFRVFANDRAIDDWPNGKGKSIIKYLATHRSQPVPKEVLMEVFWPDSDPDAARNNLNVAVYGLRKALARADAAYPFVLFRQGCYSFNPALRVWVDAEAFAECVQRAQSAEQRGDRGAAIAACRAAQAVYHSALLVDDRYEDWLIPLRQSLQDSYSMVLNQLASHDFGREDYQACVTSTARMLEVDNCNEDAHRLLMRCYSRMGHTHLALRQYHFCVDALARELNLIPSPQTVTLFQQIRQRRAI